MTKHTIFIEEDYSDAVTLISTYLLLQLEGFTPSKDSLNDMLDTVSTGIGESMESSCVECGADMAECGVLVNIDQEFSVSFCSMCVDCLEKMAQDTLVLDMEDFQQLTTELERSKLQ